MSTPYRPSNGTEGDCFFAAWCEKCARDKVMNGTVRQDDARDGDTCQLIGNSMAFNVDHPEYPKEWIRDEGGPRCTAFVPAGDPLPTPRCDRTVDMFEKKENA